MKKLVVVIVTAVAVAAVAAPAFAQGSGRIEGRVVREAGGAVGGVAVTLEPSDRATLTDSNGSYQFNNVPAGTYTVRLTLGEDTEAIEAVTVAAGETVRADASVPWDIAFVDTITVYSASRRTERITEAPAAITVIPEEQIEREGTSGQIPKLLEFTPGAEVTQSGLYDFNFNTRGFNSSLNRRILTLIDGRDPSVPFLGAQEWAAVSFPLDDLASAELVRGPGSALYGADAFNGVLNLVTKAPRFSRGGKVQLTGGDLSTLRGDVRAAGELGGGWYGKVTGGYMESEDFTVSRNVASGGPEYKPCAPGRLDPFDCVDPEPVPLALTEDELVFGGARLDKYFGNGHVATLEGGMATIEGPAFQTGIGRVQLVDIERPWWRANYNTPHWNLLGYWNGRDAADQLALRSGATLVLDTENLTFEGQGNFGFAGDRGRVVGGASYREEEIDSANDQGFQTLMFAPREEDYTGIFGQLEYGFTDALRAVVALRWDDSSLHDSELSPRASLVWAVTPEHTLRATYAEAFQTPNYSEFFLRAPVAPPVNLSALENALRPFLGGVPLGFGNIQVLALGNDDLVVEEITSYELGYTGLFTRRTYFTLDYYRNDIENFITDLITRLNPQLGNINPDFQPYRPPGVLPPQVQAIILQQLAALQGPPFNFPFVLMSNAPDGSPILAAASYTNFGEVETQGIEAGLNHYFAEDWVFEATYTWFDFDVNPEDELRADPLAPNAPENKGSVGVSYLGDVFDVSLKGRFVEGFEWRAGVFQGNVPSYQVVNLTANWHVTPSWTVGLDVSNLLDDEHYQAFGGDILERRALAHVRYSW